MRTGRSLTVCSSLLPGGGVWSQGWGLVPGGVWSRAEGSGAGGGSGPGGYIPACTEADPLPVDRMTHACENITLAQLRCGRLIYWNHLHWIAKFWCMISLQNRYNELQQHQRIIRSQGITLFLRVFFRNHHTTGITRTTSFTDHH